MAYSYVTYIGDGSTSTFSVPFPYLAQSNVGVSVNLVAASSVTWITTNTLSVSPTPASGAAVTIRRTTPVSTQAARFIDGSTLVAGDLNNADLQTLYAVQEAIDATALNLITDPLNGQYNAAYLRLENLANGINPGDAVNLGQLNTAIAGTSSGAAQIAATSATASAAAAATSATNAATSATSAAASALALNGPIPATNFPVLTGDVTTPGGSFVTTVLKTGGVLFGALATLVAGAGVASALTKAVNAAGGFLSYQDPVATTLTTGSGTYTVPAGAKYLEIEMVGGGSGGGGSGSTAGGVGTAGGATTFGTSLLTANGGPATPTNLQTALPTPATAIAQANDIAMSGALGGGQGLMNGANAFLGFAPAGASSPFGGGGFPTSAGGLVPSIAARGYGSGGGAGGYGINASVNTGWGGNSGAYIKSVITSPLASYAYSVGAGGTGGAAGTSGAPGSNGGGGIIRIIARFQ